MEEATDEELIKGAKEGAFSLENNFEIMDNMPPKFQKVREEPNTLSNENKKKGFTKETVNSFWSDKKEDD